LWIRLEPLCKARELYFFFERRAKLEVSLAKNFEERDTKCEVKMRGQHTKENYNDS
jgi:hypothetical protein